MTATPDRLWTRSFVLWWLGSAQSALGTALAGIATSFLILHQTGSAGRMGVNLALAMLPALLSPLFGTLVDRWPLRRPLVLGNLMRGALQLGIGLMALRGPVPLELIYVASFLTGLVGAFYGPASMGVTPRLVPAAQLQRATGLMQGAAQTMQLVGTVGGGVLVGTLGSAPALLIDGASFLLFAALLPLVALPARSGPPAGERFWASFRAGIDYARRSPLTLGLPVLAFFLNAAFAPMEMLMPARMTALGAGAPGFGLFFGLLLAGLAGGSFLMAWLGPRVDAPRLSAPAFAAMGVVVVGLSLSRTPLQMYVLAVAMGLTNAALNLSISMIFQQRVAPEYYGRVGSLLGMTGMAGQPLALLALAPLADRVSVTVVFGVAGTLTVLAAFVWHALLRRAAPFSPPVAMT
ncbi:DHA3 family macrolide efflux protein-like MFS transporter [Deinococcus metalli]|uniref:MFS transporter n=1 Tax=Deinococcus metalli TaxID=1141878 RepID=A0A7W8KEV7_9DEIO|nr:MFS transporter [Deinococcus metalli]MBB5376841.1 DHA3 family macrolide efflux protein-like MFS transporter [Deinococcus metalli]GHF45759.1 MFS transporter [Deinococcus metalli]